MFLNIEQVKTPILKNALWFIIQKIYDKTKLVDVGNISFVETISF